MQGEAERAGTVEPGGEKVHKHIIGRSEEDGGRLFSVVASDRTKGNWHKLKCKKFCFNIRFYSKDDRMLE